MDIIFILMVTNKMGMNDYDTGNVPHSVKIHELVAKHYNIPVFNAGKVLWDKIRVENVPVEKFLPDMVHPNDDGYEVYAQAIKGFLKNEIENAEMEEDVLPNSICEKSLEGASLVDSFVVNADGWNTEEKTLNGRYPRYISSNVPGAEFEFNFEGDSIGLYWMIAHDSGDIEWSVDGSQWEHKSSWDEYALEFDRANWALLKKDLSQGKHTLKVKVLAQKHEQSDGNWIRIGAFLVNH